MVHPVSSKSINPHRASATGFPTRKRRLAARRMLPIYATLMSLAVLPDAYSESLAAKNREGNRLFAEGKYEDAEKAYLDAQVKSPGKPEVLYNLGNALIKQKKTDQGIQALRQAQGKGDKGIQERSWYNSGNALFSMDKFQDAAEAYIQALRIDPADKDAKHNLEMALLKQQQQKQQQQKEKDKKKNQPNSEKQNQPKSENKNAQQSDRNNKSNSGAPQSQQMMEKSPQSAQREGSISKEQALRMLDALQSRELEAQQSLQEQRAQQRSGERDW